MAKVYNVASNCESMPKSRLFDNILDPTVDDQFNRAQYRHSVAYDNMHRPFTLADRPSTYDAHPPTSASCSASAVYASTIGTIHLPQKANVESRIPHDTPSGTPSPGIPQTLEYPSSTLSSASGASAHSTASSIDGSPCANATHVLPYPEKWHEPLLGLGIAPEIINTETYGNDQLPPASYHDPMFENTKFAGCVGEYGKTVPSFSSISSSVSSFPLYLMSRDYAPPVSLAADTISDRRDATIDSILEEANNQMPFPTQAASRVSTSPTAQSPTALIHQSLRTPNDNRSKAFQSRNTPASAVMRLSSPTSSPRETGNQVECLGSTKDGASFPQSSFDVSSHNRQVTPSFYVQGSYRKNTNPFFGQTSGRFVAPLESSCWFPYCLPICHIVYSHLIDIGFALYHRNSSKRLTICLHRSISHSAFRYANLSQYEYRALPWGYPCLPSSADAIIPTTVSSTVRGFESRLTPAGICKASEQYCLPLPSHIFLSTLSTINRCPQVLYCLKSFPQLSRESWI